MLPIACSIGGTVEKSMVRLTPLLLKVNISREKESGATSDANLNKNCVFIKNIL